MVKSKKSTTSLHPNKHKHCQQITMLSSMNNTLLMLADFLTAELILHLDKYIAQVGRTWRQAEYFRPSLESLSVLPS